MDIDIEMAHELGRSWGLIINHGGRSNTMEISQANVETVYGV